MSMPAPRHRMHLSDAARGLAQQMVFWGNDVRHPEGNALTRFGLTRNPSPGLQGTSCYSTDWEGGLLELHGVVVSWTSAGEKPGCLYCRERKFISLWEENDAPVPGADHCLCGTATQRWEAFQPLLCWLVRYEEWISGNLEADWRERGWRAIRKLPKGKQWLPPAQAFSWWTLAMGGAPPRPKNVAADSIRQALM